MPTIQELKEQYESLNELDNTFNMGAKGKINADCLIVFDYEYAGQEAEVSIDTDEFTAVCPWTGLPDFGTLTIRYVPDKTCIELKSLKYYLLSYTNVGIVQEHAANRVLNDLVALCSPVRMDITMDYKVRGGLHTVVSATYEQE
jgi:7-cyano-7-deazaguanine reductase